MDRRVVIGTAVASSLSAGLSAFSYFLVGKKFTEGTSNLFITSLYFFQRFFNDPLAYLSILLAMLKNASNANLGPMSGPSIALFILTWLTIGFNYGLQISAPWDGRLGYPARMPGLAIITYIVFLTVFNKLF